MSNITQELIDHLRKLGNKEVMPRSKVAGICSELILIFRFHIKEKDFKGWHKFSGDIEYPVPYPGCNNPGIGYLYHTYTLKNQWLNDEYGDNRRDLCLYLADLYESRLNNSCK